RDGLAKVSLRYNMVRDAPWRKPRGLELAATATRNPRDLAWASSTAPAGQSEVPPGGLTTNPPWPPAPDGPGAGQERCATEHGVRRAGFLSATPRTLRWDGAAGRTLWLRRARRPKPMSTAYYKAREDGAQPSPHKWGLRAASS